MQTPRLVRIICERWAGRAGIQYEAMDAFDHPTLLRMDLRELADLPVEHGATPECQPPTTISEASRLRERKMAVGDCRSTA
jgi:hypothetical protein